VTKEPVSSALYFSSVAAVIGPAGSASYAAANAALDTIALERLTSGIPSTSVQWGAWAEVGMVSEAKAVHRSMERAGIAMISPCNGLVALAKIILSGTNTSIITAIPFNWERFLLTTPGQSHLFEEFRTLSGAPRQQAQDVSPRRRESSQDMVKSMPPQNIQVVVEGCVRSVLDGPVDPNKPLIQAGLDSIGRSGLGNCGWNARKLI